MPGQAPPAAGAEVLVPAGPGAFRALLPPGHVYFREHLVRGRPVLPGVVCLDLALRGAARLRPGARVHGVVDAAWLRPVSGDEPGDDLTLAFRDGPDGATVEYTVTFRGALCGMGTLLFDARHRAPAVGLAVRDRICENTRSHLTRRDIYGEFSHMGIDYGTYFRRISYVQRHEQSSLAWLSHNDGTPLDLVNLLDCSFQSGMAISIGEHRDSLMPYSMGHMVFHAPARFPVGSAFVLTEKHSPFRTSFTVFDDSYEPLISVFDLGVKPAI
ncbi:MAG TPA: polyketide synthase dehydratase domain-containing protein [Streptomyces sp.]|nr:polyketide synthase dehydratase domain-containing protein [Streptomyces sp.]